MISSISWVRKGAAKANPIKCELDDTKMQEMASKLNISLDDLDGEMQDLTEDEQESEQETGSEAEEDWEEAEEAKESEKDLKTNAQKEPKIKASKEPKIKDPKSPSTKHQIQPPEDEDLAKYNFDDYDNEPEGVDPSMIIGNFKDLLNCHANGSEEEQDPNFIPDPELDAEEAEEAKQDLTISPSDILFVVANTADEISTLEVYLYDEPEDNLYVHHDLMIPSFPLCTEWIERSVGHQSNGNFIAVGTVDPEIEIWDLDLLDSPLPAAILGSKKVKGHKDSVMCLSASSIHRNMLLSGGADCCIKLWDLNTGAVLRSFDSIHKGKVQAVQWNIEQPSTVISGSFDKTVCVFDARQPADAIRFHLENEIESAKWNPFNQQSFIVTDEGGMVQAFDIRSPSSPLFTLQAHSKEVTAIDFNPFIPNVFFTASTDKSARLWFLDAAGTAPECVEVKRFEIGRLFAGSFCFDAPHLVCLGGSKGEVAMWNLNTNHRFNEKYLAKVAESG